MPTFPQQTIPRSQRRFLCLLTTTPLFLASHTPTCAKQPADPALDSPPTYQERLRPRFHFTAKKGYLNDPNGLLYIKGTYHLFFQHGNLSNKRWGHGVSTDLLHWKQLEDAILPNGNHPAFSGAEGGAVAVEQARLFEVGSIWKRAIPSDPHPDSCDEALQ